MKVDSLKMSLLRCSNFNKWFDWRVEDASVTNCQLLSKCYVVNIHVSCDAVTIVIQ